MSALLSEFIQHFSILTSDPASPIVYIWDYIKMLRAFGKNSASLLLILYYNHLQTAITHLFYPVFFLHHHSSHGIGACDDN